MATDVEMISVEAACGIIGGEANPIHKATYYRGVRAGRYPAPVRVSPGVSRVVKPQLIEAIERMISETEIAEASEREQLKNWIGGA